MTTTTETKKWMGAKPINCQVCGGTLGTVFIDGKVRSMGCWAIMCHSCHRYNGVGLGTGKGQKYSTKTLEKLAG